MLARPDTKVRGRFCVKRCGPSHRRPRTASAVLKNFVRQPEKTFSTVSTRCRHRPTPTGLGAKPSPYQKLDLGDTLPPTEPDGGHEATQFSRRSRWCRCVAARCTRTRRDATGRSALAWPGTATPYYEDAGANWAGSKARRLKSTRVTPEAYWIACRDLHANWWRSRWM